MHLWEHANTFPQGKKRGERIPAPQPDSDSEDVDAPFTHARPHRESLSDDYNPDEQAVDDSFIIEDDGTIAPELPTEFSMSTYQDIMHHFKIICQLFLHLAVQQPADREAAMTNLLQSTSPT